MGRAAAGAVCRRASRVWDRERRALRAWQRQPGSAGRQQGRRSKLSTAARCGRAVPMTAAGSSGCGALQGLCYAAQASPHAHPCSWGAGLGACACTCRGWVCPHKGCARCPSPPACTAARRAAGAHARAALRAQCSHTGACATCLGSAWPLRSPGAWARAPRKAAEQRGGRGAGQGVSGARRWGLPVALCGPSKAMWAPGTACKRRKRPGQDHACGAGRGEAPKRQHAAAPASDVVAPPGPAVSTTYSRAETRLPHRAPRSPAPLANFAPPCWPPPLWAAS